jgi:hypothetical protein
LIERINIYNIDLVMGVIEKLKDNDNNTHYICVGFIWNLADNLCKLTEEKNILESKFMMIFNKLESSASDPNNNEI